MPSGPMEMQSTPQGRSIGMVWPVLYGMLLVSWVLLWAMDRHAGLPPGLQGIGLDVLREMCLTVAGETSFAGLWAMWAIMGAAMMLPSALPAIGDYAALSDQAARRGQEAAPQRATLGLAAGYLSVWWGFAILAAVAQIALARAGLLDFFGQSISTPLNIVLLVVAGVWQLTPQKDACVSRCRAPMSVFLTQWRPGGLAAYRTGLRLGIDCVGCCWALMLLAFVGGVSSLLWMGAATLFMTLEKLPGIGKPLTRPMGVLLLVAAAVLAARSLTV